MRCFSVLFSSYAINILYYISLKKRPVALFFLIVSNFLVWKLNKPLLTWGDGNLNQKIVIDGFAESF